MDYMYYGSVQTEPHPTERERFIVTLKIEHDDEDRLDVFTVVDRGHASLEPLAEELIQREEDQTVLRLSPERDERMILVLQGRNSDALNRIIASYLICNGEVIELPGMLDLIHLVGAKILLENGQQLTRGTLS